MKKTNVEYLIAAEMSYNTSVRYYSVNVAERFKNIMDEIKSRMTSEELTEYTRRKNYIESPEERSRRIRSQLRNMEMNREKQSI